LKAETAAAGGSAVTQQDAPTRKYMLKRIREPVNRWRFMHRTLRQASPQDNACNLIRGTFFLTRQMVAVIDLF
jgi:hypothetical protein